MGRTPSSVCRLLRWAIVFPIIFFGTIGYFRIMTLMGTQDGESQSVCNFSTSSNDVCADAVRYGRIEDKPWTGGYSVLTPTRGYLSEAIRYPNMSGELIAELRPACPPARRYVLDAVGADRLYFVRICFKDTSSVNYRVRLLHVRRSSLHNMDTDASRTVQRVAEPLDTHVMTVSMQCATGDHSALFRRKEGAWCEAFDLTKQMPSLHTSADAAVADRDDPFLPVMEVTAHALTGTPYPSLFPCVHFDIHLDDTALNTMPLHAVTTALPIALFALTVTLCLPWLLRRMQDPTRPDDESAPATAVPRATLAKQD